MSGFTIFGDLRTAELAPVAGWTHVYNVNTDIVNPITTGSGTVTHANSMAILSTGAAINSSAKIFTKRVLRYLPGIGALGRCTFIFDTPVDGNTQFIGLGTPENALFIGFSNTDFCINRRSNSVDDIITSNLFSFPTPPIDFEKGNVFEINYQWLGYGLIRFSYEDPITHEFIPFHDIKYPNTAVVPSLLNPTLPFCAEVKNTTNDTDVVVKTGSAMAFREGAYTQALDPLILLRGFKADATISTEIPILSIRTNSTYQGITNQIHAVLEAVSFSSDGTKNVDFTLYKGTELTNESWVNYDTDVSSLQSDVSATSITGGEFMFDWRLNKNGAVTDHIGQWDLSIEPGEVLTITALSASSSVVGVTVLMEEPF